MYAYTDISWKFVFPTRTSLVLPCELVVPETVHTAITLSHINILKSYKVKVQNCSIHVTQQSSSPLVDPDCLTEDSSKAKISNFFDKAVPYRLDRKRPRQKTYLIQLQSKNAKEYRRMNG